ncbi:Uncharacterized protein FVE85_6390 [Porphyridium purpureum]|uniref:ORM1-like protein 3 n=1 Tax=Porphyridium purpureum TaxID=35688 RepID=A0A5J4Z643_PORPP|nr:Uncharacterized protein FVE85_6390 [Porphyridium purpureum]|eukprot:POR6507..scf295_1
MQCGDGPPALVGVEWFSHKGVWLFYGSLVLTGRILLGTLLQTEPYVSWTIVNVVHACITFVTFHWIKGSPFETMWFPGSDRLTWWEQLDMRKQATPNRKFCVAMVIFLFLVCYEATPLEKRFALLHALNFVVAVVMIVAKLPVMDKVRIFGINK